MVYSAVTEPLASHGPARGRWSLPWWGRGDEQGRGHAPQHPRPVPRLLAHPRAAASASPLLEAQPPVPLPPSPVPPSLLHAAPGAGSSWFRPMSPPGPWGCLCQEQPAGKHYLWPEPDAALREAVTAHGGPASRAERMSLVRQSLASLQSAFLIKCISTTPGCRLSVPQAAHMPGIAWPRSGAQDPVVLSRARWGEGRTWS